MLLFNLKVCSIVCSSFISLPDFIWHAVNDYACLSVVDLNGFSHELAHSSDAHGIKNKVIRQHGTN